MLVEALSFLDTGSWGLLSTLVYLTILLSMKILDDVDTKRQSVTNGLLSFPGKVVSSTVVISYLSVSCDAPSTNDDTDVTYKDDFRC